MLAKNKEIAQLALIKTLGFKNYLLFVSMIRIWTLSLLKYEKDFLYFTKMIPPKCTILDIGANIGVTTYFLARANPSCTVHSFEPIPDNLSNLSRIVSHYKLDSVTIHDCGLGETSGLVQMIMPVINGVRRHALCQVDDGSSQYKEGVRFTVSIKRLDEVAELKESSDVKAIKIDVENFEHAVFIGGLELIRRNRPIIFCELWDTENKVKIFNLFHKMGYRINILDDGKLQTAPETGFRESADYFFIPEEWPLSI